MVARRPLATLRAATLVAMVGAMAGCTTFGREAAADPDVGSGGALADQCRVDAECVPAASSCCDCPSFALPRTSGWAEACEDVVCPMPGPGQACAPSAAVCADGVCMLACPPLQCDAVCADGFTTDAAGCLLCACAPAPMEPPTGCTQASDCVRAPADCCGCARGGTDTAVLAAEAGDLADSLDCPADPACPGVDACVAGLVPACTDGRCELVDPTAGALPPGACGRPDLPACPPPTVCVLNASEDAIISGVGLCQAP
ncbi:MAG: hypothetical protein KA297_10735 [Kofleriaceae bacterium]|nr:hypothetical protein [Kofleriaceae bacterium]